MAAARWIPFLFALPSAGAKMGGWGVVVRSSIKNTTLSSLESLDVGATVSKELAKDGLVLGGSYNYNSAKKVIPDRVSFSGSIDALGRTIDTRMSVGIMSPFVSMDLACKVGASTDVKATFSSDTALPESVEGKRRFRLFSRPMAVNAKLNCRTGAKRYKLEADLADGAAITSAVDWSGKDDLEVKVKFRTGKTGELTPTLRPFGTTNHLSYEYQQALPQGGGVRGRFVPGEELAVEWQDPGLAGTWTTKLIVPIKDTSASSIGFKRTFKL